ncbi:MAG: hypothetical protein KAR24_00920 [Candidatus Pacebacteria bacterium]|nr:hypothetical protein [Candidatus Paceibacterota bacterium]
MKGKNIIVSFISFVFVYAVLYRVIPAVCEFVFFLNTEKFHIHPFLTVVILVATFFLLLTTVVAKIEAKPFCFLFFHQWDIIKTIPYKEGETGVHFTTVYKRCKKCKKIRTTDINGYWTKENLE